MQLFSSVQTNEPRCKKIPAMNQVLASYSVLSGVKGLCSRKEDVFYLLMIKVF